MRSKLVAIAAMMVCLGSHASDTKLFSTTLHIESVSQGNRTDSSITFTELERTETTSIVEIVSSSPGRLDQGQVITGICLLMKARGKTFMLGTLRRVSNEPLRQEVTFVESGPDGDTNQLRAGIVSILMCEKSWLHKQSPVK